MTSETARSRQEEEPPGPGSREPEVTSGNSGDIYRNPPAETLAGRPEPTSPPRAARPGPAAAPARPRARAPQLGTPALTGLSTSRWDQLIAALSTPYQLQREAALYIARGGPPARKPAGGHPPALNLAEQVLITVLRRRFRLPQNVLASLFGVVTGTIAKAERQARPSLEQYGHQIEPAGTPIKTLAGLTAYASAHGIELTPKAKPAC
jgi:hypothetical protein